MKTQKIITPRINIPRRFEYYELIIFFFLVVEFLALSAKQSLGAWEKTFYLLTYEFGPVSRALIGSVFSLFTDRITHNMIYVSACISYIFLCVLISFLLGKLIRKSNADIKVAVITIVILFLSSPFSITYLLGIHIGRFDVYWIIITLLALIFLKQPNLKWTVPFLCAVAVSVHQGYMDTYMPALAIPMLYEVYKSKYAKKNIILFSASCLTMIVLFLVYQFYSASLPFNDAIGFADYLSSKADFKASAPQLYVEYYAPFTEYWLEDIFPLMKTFAMPLTLSYLFISFPLFAFFGYIWKRAFQTANNKFLKFIFLLCAIAPIAFIPAALFGLDWDRWWAAAINCQFILIFYFIYTNEFPILDALKKIAVFISDHFLFILLVFIFFSMLTFSEAVTNMFSFINNSEKFMNHYVNYFNEHLFYSGNKDYWYIMGS